MQLRNHVGLLQQVCQGLPDDFVQSVSTDIARLTAGRTPDGERRVAFTFIVQVFVFLADAVLPNTHQT